MRHLALLITMLVSFSAPSWAKKTQLGSVILHPDLPITLEECLHQALLIDSFDGSLAYMGDCAVRFPKAEREAFVARVQRNPARVIRVNNLVANGVRLVDFQEEERARHAQMPEPLKPVLGYWMVHRVDWAIPEQSGNIMATIAAEGFQVFPEANVVVAHLEGLGFNRRQEGECIVVGPKDTGPTDLRFPRAWSQAFYATASQYGIRGNVVVSEDVFRILARGNRRPRVLSSKKGPLHTIVSCQHGCDGKPRRKEKRFRTTWYLVALS